MPKAYTAVDWSMNHFEVHFKMKLTYRTPIYDDEDEIHDPDADITGSSENPEGEIHVKTQWDDDFPWSKWYSAEDPVKGEILLLIIREICFGCIVRVGQSLFLIDCLDTVHNFSVKFCYLLIC